MNQPTLRDLTGIPSPQLQAQLQLLVACSMELTEQAIRLHREYERDAAARPEAEYDRYMQLHAAYMQAHKLHMDVHAEFMVVHEELARRGRSIQLARPPEPSHARVTLLARSRPAR
jgi:hypothetical protein